MSHLKQATCRRCGRRGVLGVVWALALVTLLAQLSACTQAGEGASVLTGRDSTPGLPVALPHFDHIVMVIEENQSFSTVMDSDASPYLHSLAQQGALFTNSHAVTHPSEPNYLALFAGSTFGLTSDVCPQVYTGSNLGHELIARGLTFTGYSENLPKTGFTGCTAGDPLDPTYARKHNPWADFADVPTSSNQPFANFPQNFSQLPTLAVVVPNEQHDMHSGSIADGDGWLKQHLDSYAQWAQSHNSLLGITWDEDDGSTSNHIPTILVGAHVHPGQYGELVTHYDVLRTLEALEGLPFSAEAGSARAIADVWQA